METLEIQDNNIVKEIKYPCCHPTLLHSQGKGTFLLQEKVQKRKHHLWAGTMASLVWVKLVQSLKLAGPPRWGTWNVHSSLALESKSPSLDKPLHCYSQGPPLSPCEFSCLLPHSGAHRCLLHWLSVRPPYEPNQTLHSDCDIIWLKVPCCREWVWRGAEGAALKIREWRMNSLPSETRGGAHPPSSQWTEPGQRALEHLTSHLPEPHMWMLFANEAGKELRVSTVVTPLAAYRAALEWCHSPHCSPATGAPQCLPPSHLHGPHSWLTTHS